jgi:DNA polymerase III delta prime subunit
MTQSIPKALREEFIKLVQKGDEAKARQFLVDHFKEFPESTQDAILTAFIEEAVTKKNREESAVASFRKEGLTNMEALGQAKKELEKKAKLAEIKEGIKP